MGPLISRLFFSEYPGGPHIPELPIHGLSQTQMENGPWLRSVDAEGCLQAWLYAILYKGPEHPWIMASTYVTNPSQIPRDGLESTMAHADFWLCISWCPLPALFKGQL